MFRIFRTRYRLINNNVIDDVYPFKIQVNHGFDSLWSWNTLTSTKTKEYALKVLQGYLDDARPPKITVIKESIV